LEYVARIDGLLEASLCREALAENDKHCQHCNKGILAIWRCKDCSTGVPMCRGCIRLYHKENPFHRIEQWNGDFFRAAEQWEVGTYLLVRHHSGVTLCEDLIAQETFLEIIEKQNDDAEQKRLRAIAAPQSAEPPTASSAFPWPTSNEAELVDLEADNDVEMSNPEHEPDEGDDEEFIRYLQELRDGDVDGDDGDKDGKYQDGEDVEDDIEEDEMDGPSLKRYLPEEIMAGTTNIRISAQQVVGTYVRVVHTNGIHNIAMISCECRGHDVLPSDLIAARLLPASFERIRTLFSAQLLDHFRLCNLELKSSAYHFYHLLQRLTSPMAPAGVVNLYREFRRMSRIWRWMKRLKWAGYGNTIRKSNEAKAGQLTVFCPACPQPGINIPDNWKEDKAR
jgi:CxC2 like cysteine cluster associated with KDZ transposases